MNPDANTGLGAAVAPRSTDDADRERSVGLAAIEGSTHGVARAGLAGAASPEDLNRLYADGRHRGGLGAAVADPRNGLWSGIGAAPTNGLAGGLPSIRRDLPGR